jgi:hypothetical protein
MRADECSGPCPVQLQEIPAVGRVARQMDALPGQLARRGDEPGPHLQRGQGLALLARLGGSDGRAGTGRGRFVLALHHDGRGRVETLRHGDVDRSAAHGQLRRHDGVLAAVEPFEQLRAVANDDRPQPQMELMGEEVQQIVFVAHHLSAVDEVAGRIEGEEPRSSDDWRMASRSRSTGGAVGGRAGCVSAGLGTAAVCVVAGRAGVGGGGGGSFARSQAARPARARARNARRTALCRFSLRARLARGGVQPVAAQLVACWSVAYNSSVINHEAAH